MLAYPDNSQKLFAPRMVGCTFMKDRIHYDKATDGLPVAWPL